MTTLTDPTDQMIDRFKVYVHSRDVLAESGLQAQVETSPSLELEPRPSSADVSVVAWARLDDLLVARIEQLRQTGCHRILLVLTAVDADDLPAILDTGACGVLRSGDASAERLAEAAVAAANGGGCLPPDLLGQLLRRAQHHRPWGPGTGTSARPLLAEREEAVLKLMAEGYDTIQIAHTLHYSERTIKGIVHNIVHRFGLRNRSHAVAYALRHGLI